MEEKLEKIEQAKVKVSRRNTVTVKSGTVSDLIAGEVFQENKPKTRSQSVKGIQAPLEP